MKKRLYSRLENPVIAILLLITVHLATAGLYIKLTDVPVPKVHDEFSHLLIADTFAEGRLANPTPPLCEHFESFHIFLTPSYASKYPPLQGSLLFLGSKLFGHPLAGVWLSFACMLALIYWALRPWLGGPWATVSAAFVITQFGTSGTWAMSYWGGAANALGGALLLGTVLHLCKRPLTPKYGITLSLGLALLANSRPYEGLVLCIPTAIALLALWKKQRWTLPQVATKLMLPALIILTINLAFMGYYNFRCTGDPLRMPYVEYKAQYSTQAPDFSWEEIKEPPTYRHKRIASFWTNHANDLHKPRGNAAEITQAYAKTFKTRWQQFSKQYFNPFPWWLPLLLIFITRSKKALWCLACIIAIVAASSVTLFFPRYMAPVVICTCALLGFSLRQINAWRLAGKPIGTFLTVGLLLYVTIHFALETKLQRWNHYNTFNWAPARQAVQDQLEKEPGKQLLIVSYEDDVNVHDEWVYNKADIPKAEVIWARHISAEKDKALIAHYSDHNPWRLHIRRYADYDLNRIP